MSIITPQVFSAQDLFQKRQPSSQDLVKGSSDGIAAAARRMAGPQPGILKPGPSGRPASSITATELAGGPQPESITSKLTKKKGTLENAMAQLDREIGWTRGDPLRDEIKYRLQRLAANTPSAAQGRTSLVEALPLDVKNEVMRRLNQRIGATGAALAEAAGPSVVPSGIKRGLGRFAAGAVNPMAQVEMASQAAADPLAVPDAMVGQPIRTLADPKATLEQKTEAGLGLATLAAPFALKGAGMVRGRLRGRAPVAEPIAAPKPEFDVTPASRSTTGPVVEPAPPVEAPVSASKSRSTTPGPKPARGRGKPKAETPAPVQKMEVEAPKQEAVRGKSFENAPSLPERSVSTPDLKTKIRVQPKLVEMDDVIVSNDPEGVPDPRFPQAFQGRGRGGKNYADQYRQKALEFNPEHFAPDWKTIDEGPTVVDERGVAIAGSGRENILKMTERLNQEGYGSYRAMLEDLFGKEAVGKLKNPRMVFEVLDKLTDEQKIDINKRSDIPRTTGKQVTEKAKSDAELLPSEWATQFESGGRTLEEAFSKPGNRRLLDRFLANIPSEERTGLLSQTTGEPTSHAHERAANAALADFLGPEGSRALTSHLDDADFSARVMKGLQQSMPDLAPVLRSAKEGNASAAAFRKDLADAMGLIDEFKKQDAFKKPRDYFDQGTMVERSERAAQFATDLLEAKSQAEVKTLLEAKSREALSEAEGLFGAEPESPKAPAKDAGVTELAAGVDPAKIIKRADDLGITTGEMGSFTIGPREKKPGPLSWLRSPRSIRTPDGKTLVKGDWERVSGEMGAKASDIAFDAENRIHKKLNDFHKALDAIGQMREVARKLLPEYKGRGARARYDKDFVALVEKPFDDPTRKGRNKAEQMALDSHDEMSKGFVKYMNEAREARGLPVFEEGWGISEGGYFRHLFSGDVRLIQDGKPIGFYRDYVQAQKAAIDILAKDPKANLSAELRNIAGHDPTLRVSTRQYFKTLGKLEDTLEVPKAELMEDLRGIIGRRAAKQKFSPYQQKRKGVEGFRTDYDNVMRAHVAQLVRTQELSRLNHDLQPIIENMKAGHRMVNDKRVNYTPDGVPQPGAAEMLENYLNDQWAVPTTSEKIVGGMLESLPIVKNYVTNGTLSAQSIASHLRGLQNYLKLYPKISTSVINNLQPLTTLWPFIKTSDYAGLLVEAWKPSTWKRLGEMGVVDVGTKMESTVSGRGLRAKVERAIPFNFASNKNRILGYLAGERAAKAAGMSAADVHKYGMAMAEKVEFNSTKWNKIPVARGSGMATLTQYRGFMFKNLENVEAVWSKQPGDTRLTRGGRILKWSVAQGAFGGVRSVSAAGKLIGGAIVVDMAAEKLEKWFGWEATTAREFARSVYYGLPQLIGIDLSQSLSLVDPPVGDTWEQKLAGQFGPTVNTLANLAEDAYKQVTAKKGGSRKEVADQQKSAEWRRNKMGRAVTPATRSIDAIQQAIQFGPDHVKINVSKDDSIILTKNEAILSMLGFTPVKQTEYYERKDMPKSKGRGRGR